MFVLTTVSARAGINFCFLKNEACSDNGSLQKATGSDRGFLARETRARRWPAPSTASLCQKSTSQGDIDKRASVKLARDVQAKRALREALLRLRRVSAAPPASNEDGWAVLNLQIGMEDGRTGVHARTHIVVGMCVQIHARRHPFVRAGEREGPCVDSRMHVPICACAAHFGARAHRRTHTATHVLPGSLQRGGCAIHEASSVLGGDHAAPHTDAFRALLGCRHEASCAATTGLA